VAEVKELLKIKEKRIKEFEGKEQKLRKTGTEKKNLHAQPQYTNSLSP